jgi:hypothetical protein
MSAEHFRITDHNPNDDIGGGGCVCGDSKLTGCTGPYAVFYATETDSNLSPHVVLSLACARAFVERADAREDAVVVDAEAVEE